VIVGLLAVTGERERAPTGDWGLLDSIPCAGVTSRRRWSQWWSRLDLGRSPSPAVGVGRRLGFRQGKEIKQGRRRTRGWFRSEAFILRCGGRHATSSSTGRSPARRRSRARRRAGLQHTERMGMTLPRSFDEAVFDLGCFWCWATVCDGCWAA
jgi:hypothetical protein